MEIMEINEALEWMDRLVTFCGRDVHGRAMKTIRAALAESTNSSHNNAMPSCQGCGLEHQSKINATCSVCARTHHDYWHERQ